MKTLSIIVPTYNERENILVLVDRINRVLPGIDFEIVIVDDNSPDKTWEEGERIHLLDPRVRVLRRVGRKGLSSAVIEGALSSQTQFIAVMDGDLQHDETILAAMLETAKQGADLVIGSRYLKEAGVGDWEKKRTLLSQWGTKLTLKLIGHKVSDPLSGFFLMRKQLFSDCAEKLVGQGFKILLDVLSNFPPGTITIKEVPFVFRRRSYGESKLSPSTIKYFVEFLFIKTFGRYIPIRFVKFCLVGLGGAMVHFFLLYLFYRKFLFSYQLSLIIAIECAIISNYLYNNFWTFWEYRKIKAGLIGGLLRYNIATAFGGVANFIISSYLLEHGFFWVWASLYGAMVGVLWNYTLSKVITWQSYSD